ncbi:PTS system glucitol/sorbitol-specific IIA component [Enterococcus sp. PF1-24]|uniref:PTS glucitol/sorbitol transporter subunit IIA n=1 Tax=unclassified Enterococcus TaxID=2608891 RepID=UPI0024768E5E|nr:MULTISPECIES: PTS glucitol/sorbitol transporter subunit IIA [unclassified Enterococcus]MDH6363237.1 PTS system glucitol/sorbitol-specific IIA component [Enterococcus sp. PFB1-1]MDH6400462.1 PTS system glucitol/sorbitol-specific IIA component [Enterococcus sp. PF1-24]
MKIFETKVTEIGSEAELFKEEKMMILFGENAPNGLAEYCYKIIMNKTISEIEKGMSLCFDEQLYKITAVGNVVTSNLNELGHITIKFTGDEIAELPGSLYVENLPMPLIECGGLIRILE